MTTEHESSTAADALSEARNRVKGAAHLLTALEASPHQIDRRSVGVLADALFTAIDYLDQIGNPTEGEKKR